MAVTLDDANLVWYDGGDGPSGWAVAKNLEGGTSPAVVVVSGDGNGNVHKDVPYREEGGGVTIRNKA